MPAPNDASVFGSELHILASEASDVFDRHVRVNPVLIEQVDCVDLEPLERAFDRLLDMGAASVELPADDLRDIDAAASKIKVEGARYPEKLERMTGL
jgi:hypothetical protein